MEWINEFLGSFQLIATGMGASWVQWAWPDGRPWMMQPQVRIQAFQIILSEANAALAKEAAHGGQDHH
jgi:hypothetical protein